LELECVWGGESGARAQGRDCGCLLLNTILKTTLYSRYWGGKVLTINGKGFVPTDPALANGRVMQVVSQGINNDEVFPVVSAGRRRGRVCVRE
jgi:hypothetical protein